MNWTPLDNWIVVIGALCAVACALPGTFLVLRQMSMMGDAMSHAVLPGLAVAFLVTGERSSLPMFIGAAVVGLLTALFTEWINRVGNVDRGASMGIVFTTLFALGLVLIVQAANHVELDPGCVLYGAIEFAPFDTALTLEVAGTKVDVPRSTLVLGGVLFVNFVFVLLFFKELRLSSFDAALAETLGFSPTLMHHALMVLVAITTVAAFEVVGSIIVIAMLIVPAATAQLLTGRLGLMLLLASGIAAASAVLGHVAALVVPRWLGFDSTSTAGMMAVVAGTLFLLAMIFAPQQGLMGRLSRAIKNRTAGP